MLHGLRYSIKVAFRIDNCNLGKVQQVGPDIIMSEKGLVNKKRYSYQRISLPALMAIHFISKLQRQMRNDSGEITDLVTLLPRDSSLYNIKIKIRPIE